MTNPNHPEPWANLRAAIQYVLDCEGDGYQLVHHVTILGLQRMDSSGQVHATSWVLIPAEQADYITDGLIAAAEDQRSCFPIEDE